MQILLNLLPPAHKTAIAERFRSRFFLWQIALLLLLEIVAAAFLGAILFMLHARMEIAESSSQSVEQFNAQAQTLAQYRKRFQEANELSKRLSSYFDRHWYWSELYVTLDRIVPPTVGLYTVGTKDTTVTLSGLAKTRDDLLQFEERLKSEECVTNLKVPVSNLFSQTQVEFLVTFDFTRKCLLHQSR